MKIYLDMDGVLCNFHKGVDLFFNLPENTYSKLKIEEKGELLKKISGTDFFLTLPKFDGVDELINQFWIADTSFNILTRPFDLDYVNSSLLKKKWIENNLECQPNEIIFEKHKFLYATSDGESNILIDDTKSNIDRWEANGGLGILFNRYTMSFNDLYDTFETLDI